MKGYLFPNRIFEYLEKSSRLCIAEQDFSK